MLLKQEAERAIEDLLPPELKEAFQDYRRVETMKDEIGNRLIEGGQDEGGVRPVRSLDHLVGTREQRRRHFEAERFRRLSPPLFRLYRARPRSAPAQGQRRPGEGQGQGRAGVQ
jgi:hypothetical protein